MTFAPSYGLITGLDEVEARAAAMAAARVAFGFDIETGYDGEPREKASLHPEENFISGISFAGDLTWARYVPLRHDTGVNLDNRRVAEALWPLFHVTDDEGLPLGIAHGAIFELRVMARWFLRNLWDHPEFGPQVLASHGYFPVRSCTLLESFTEGENQRHGLKDMVFANYGHRMAELLDLFPEGLTKKEQKSIRFSVLDQHRPEVTSYACEDSLWALHAHLDRWPRVRNSLVYKTEMAVLYVVAEMCDEGLVYDWNFLREGSRKAHDFADRYQAEVLGDFSALAGEDISINLNSSAQLGDVLYNKCGMPVKKWTDGGKSGIRKPSVDAKIALKGLSNQYEAVAKLLKWKGINTLCNNFLDKYERDFTYAPDGRAHPGLLQHGTITGRFSAEGPNYQQSPKKYKVTMLDGSTFEINFRDSIRAPYVGSKPWWAWVLEDYGYVYPDPGQDLGWYILGFDYSQIELRVFAGESGETALIEAFKNGQDVHRLTAALMLGKPLEDVTKDDRGIGKTMNFALAYGMTEEGLADRLGITVEEAHELFAQYHAAYPHMRTWTEQTVAQSRRDGYVTTRFGRKVRIWEYDSPHRWVRRGGERTAGNAPIQGSATGDYAKIAMVRAQKALKAAGLDDRVRLFMNVHDALEWYVRKDVPPGEVIEVLRDAVVFPIDGWPPMVAEWHLGERWGSVKDLELLPDGGLRVKEEDEDDAPVAAEVEDGEEDELDKVRVSSVLRPTPENAALKQALGTMSAYLDKPVTVTEPATPRTVIIQLSATPTEREAQNLLALLQQNPGPNTVVLRVPEGDVTVALTSSLAPRHEPQVSVIFGGAIVHYDLDSVDTAELARGLDL